MGKALRKIVFAGSVLGLCFAGYWLTVHKQSASDTGRPSAATPQRQTSETWSQSPFGQNSKTPPGIPATTQSEPPVIYSHNGHRVDLDGLTPAQFIARWNALARSGNPDAAYKMYQAESICANKDESPAARNADEREQLIHERDGLNKLCDGVMPTQVQERIHFLAIAARGGNVNAQVDFYMEGPEGYDSNLPENQDDPALRQWKKDAMENLQAAAAKGNSSALGLLAQTYHSGDLVPRDDKMALTYTVAESIVRNTTLSQTVLHKRFGKQLSDADFTEAQKNGTRIAQECCIR